MENQIKIAKLVAEALAGSSAGFVIKSVIANNLDEPENLKEKVQITAGSFVIGAMIARQARLFTESKIDEAVKSWHDTKAKMEAKKEESQTEAGA